MTYDPDHPAEPRGCVGLLVQVLGALTVGCAAGYGLGALWARAFWR
jgi:hypothetical protein